MDSRLQDLEDTHEETKTPPPKKGKAKAADAGRPTPPKRTISAVSEGDSQKPKRGKKAKEGPYTCYKEQGSIPEPELPRRSDALPAGKKAFTVLSWNVGGLRAFLKSRKKDHDSTADSEAALKELSETLPDYELACVNYSTAKKGYSGVLGRIVVLEFETVYVVVCYVPNSGDQLKRLTQRSLFPKRPRSAETFVERRQISHLGADWIEEWDVQLRQRLQDLGKKKHVLLMGDLNDGFSLRHPEVLGAFTYWSVRAGNRPKNRGLRLDYAMEHQTHFWDAFHLPAVATGDHCPVGAVLAV
eukprot:g6692.t1